MSRSLTLGAAGLTPRLLTEEQAAAYLGDIPLAEVRRLGRARVKMGISTRYDVRALDALLDEQLGLPSQSASPDADNDAENALDRFIAGS